MNTHIVITDTNLGDGSIERDVLVPVFEVSHHDARTEEEVLKVGADADGLLVQWAPLTERVLSGLPRLRAVVRYGIGLDNIDLAAAARLGIEVRNVDDYCLAEVADHAVASVYAHNRRLTAASRSYTVRGWTTEGIAAPLPPGEDPVGIAGFGRIGRAVARRATALGFPVHVWDPYVTDLPSDVTGHTTLSGLAAAVNHLTLHVPSTEQTRGIVGRAVLDALGPAGHLVNTARGALVEEAALLAALEAGTLGFASLDVLAGEPPSGISAELAGHDRVLVTPHVAYLSTRSLPMLQRRAAEIMRDLLTAAG
ncbi:C-terminal binding protein [Streptosporangium sp. NBC_01755]|uniref:NAD(P)-dependent oxidoreductase n=1 Tax=Streptosporangium sp. NBC_01755 TaxID=2975949 RepID=UPI002DD86796|nr:NAD(P)-dependent oxidoreductase [Streptosporangium sp. NBC_01755]WSD01346.1 C-terminal binding protein [Streptosporangium sp. NBC_01755]